MRKVKIDKTKLFQWRYLEFIFTDLFIEKSCTFNMAFVQIAEFDWLPGRHKGKFWREKHLLLRNHKVDEDDTFHTCL